MSATFGRRFASYIVDFLILSFALNLVMLIIPENKNVTKLNKQLEEVTSEYVESGGASISASEMQKYVNDSASLSYRIDKENFLYSIIVIVIYILYYVVFQFFNKGQTLGKKLMGIRVEKENGELTINDFIFRSFIINSLLYSMITLVLLFTTKDAAYLYSIGILGFIQFVVMLVSALMIGIRKDKKALQDIITKTKVVEVTK